MTNTSEAPFRKKLHDLGSKLQIVMLHAEMLLSASLTGGDHRSVEEIKGATREAIILLNEIRLITK